MDPDPTILLKPNKSIHIMIFVKLSCFPSIQAEFSLSMRVSAFISLALVVVLVVQNNTILTDFKLYLTLLT